MNLRFLLYLLMVGGLFACKTDPASNTEGDTTALAPAGSDYEYKSTDNVLRIGMRVEPTGLNPVLSTQAASRYVGEMVFQTLNSQDPQTFEQVPCLASIADISREADGTVSYSYLIDERANWPNGLPVTATDVIFSLKIVLNPLVLSGAYRPYYDMVANIVTSPGNEKRFKVTTKRPYLLAEQAIGSLSIYPEYAYDPDGLLRSISLADLTNNAKAQKMAEENEQLKGFAEAFSAAERSHEPDQVVGSGPYRLVAWEDGQKITLERRQNYWGAKSSDPWLAAKPEKIIFNIIPDAGTMGNALRDELVDVVADMGVGTFKELREDEYLQQRYEFSTVPSMKYFGLLLNMQNPLLRDVETRQALAHAIDVDQLIEQIFPGNMATRANGPVLPAKSYYNTDLPPIPYSPERASELLAEAGWEDSNNDGTVDKLIDGAREELAFEFLIFPSAASEQVGALVKEWASEVGVSIEVVRQDFRALYGELDKGNYAMAIAGFGFDPNPDEFTQLWASTSIPPNGTNRTGFSNAEADKLIKQIRVTLNDQDREPLYRRFQEIVYETQPMIFLFSPDDRVVVSKRFEYEPTSASPNLDFNALEQKSWNKE